MGTNYGSNFGASTTNYSPYTVSSSSCRGAPWQPLSPSCRTLATTTQHLSLEEGQRRLQEVLPADRRILQALSRPTPVGSSEAQGTAPQAQSQAALPSRLSSRPSSP